MSGLGALFLVVDNVVDTSILCSLIPVSPGGHGWAKIMVFTLKFNRCPSVGYVI